jgi:DNA integrity scanning protein DisA with diadenylate cyclase activity
MQVPGDALVIMNGTVIDGTGRAPIADGVVVIDGDRILAVGVFYPASSTRTRTALTLLRSGAPF